MQPWDDGTTEKHHPRLIRFSANYYQVLRNMTTHLISQHHKNEDTPSRIGFCTSRMSSYISRIGLCFVMPSLFFFFFLKKKVLF
jgi:hypothetical protein